MADVRLQIAGKNLRLGGKLIYFPESGEPEDLGIVDASADPIVDASADPIVTAA